MRVLRVGTAAVLVALVCASQAWAQFPTDRPLDDRRTRASLLLASEFWGSRPSCGRPRVYVAELGGEGMDSHGAANDGGCVIWVDPSNYWRTDDVRDWNDQRVRYCTLIAHEVGHLLGHRHVARIQSVMHPYEVGNFPTRGCLRRFDRREFIAFRRDAAGFATR